jgi:hypothetical protein
MVRQSVRLVRRAVRKVFLEPREATLSARLALWVVLVSALVRATSLPRAQQLSSARLRTRGTTDPERTAAHLAGTLDALLGLDVFVFRPSCWKRSLVLHRFLAIHGIESRIAFGVQKLAAGEPLQGHAWLERDGQPFLEKTPGTYVVTFTLPRPVRGAPVPRL